MITVGCRQVQAVAVGLFQNAGFMMIAPMPDGTDGMDHRFGRQITRQCNDRLARRALALLLTHHLAERVRANPMVSNTLNKLAGLFLIAFGVKLALSR